MREALQRAWLHRGPIAWALWPLSLVYGGLAALHRATYAAGLARPTRLPVPVVVVGNVVAGGAGKTPLVIALLEHLSARGLRAGVISRGYGRGGDACLEVLPDSDPRLVGDEPLLIRRRAGAPVFVARTRAEAGLALLAAHPGTQVLVSDDGLQHLALARDVDICVFDERGIGNGLLLPAGPLREAWPRPATVVVQHGNPRGIAGLPMVRQLADWAVRADGTRIALADLRGQRLKALAGIARPGAFFAMLEGKGLELSAREALPDHDAFEGARPSDEQGFTLVCTEKDAAKLWAHRPDAWAVPLEVRVDARIFATIDRLLAPRLSSTDGPQTA